MNIMAKHMSINHIDFRDKNIKGFLCLSNFHSNPNPKCPVGSKIHSVLQEPLSAAQKALEEELNKTTVSDLVKKL